MARLLVVVVVLASFIALAHGYCFSFQTEEVESDGKKITYCKLENGTLKEAGESWVDETACLHCSCGNQDGGCCAFGYAMTSMMSVNYYGEECKAVKTGDGCWDFTFVKESDPSVDCLNPPTLPPLILVETEPEVVE